MPREGGWAKVALIVVAGLVLAWLAVRQAVVALAAPVNAAAAAAVAPGDPRVREALALQELQRNMLSVPDGLRATAPELLAAAPLSDMPFVIAGAHAVQHGAVAEGTRLLEEARRRAPRGRAGRYFLLEAYLRGGDASRASTETMVLVRLVPETASVLVPAIARFAGDPQSGPVLRRVLREDRGLREQVLEAMVLSGADPAAILDIGGAAPPPGEPVATWQHRLLNRLVEEQRFAAARALWGRLKRAPADAGLLSDPGFAENDPLPPFSWDLLASGEGNAEPNRKHGIDVEYYGRNDAALARQLLTLPPGRYRLRFRATGTPARGAEPLGWSVVCAGSNARLGTKPLLGVAPVGTEMGMPFVVPAAGCAAQWLALQGRAAEFPVTRVATIDQVRLERAP